MVIDEERPRSGVDIAALEAMLNARRADCNVSLAACPIRMMLLCGLPLLLAVGMFSAASKYHDLIPDGEMALRNTIVGVCCLFGVLSLASAVITMLRHWNRAIHVESTGVVIQAASQKRSYRWDEITVGYPHGQKGFRNFTICTPDGQATVHEILYPRLPEVYGKLTRAATARR